MNLNLQNRNVCLSRQKEKILYTGRGFHYLLNSWSICFSKTQDLKSTVTNGNVRVPINSKNIGEKDEHKSESQDNDKLDSNQEDPEKIQQHYGNRQ